MASTTIVLLDSLDKGAVALCRMLTEGGYDCYCVTSAPAAEKIVHEQQPKVILINWDLPEAPRLLGNIRRSSKRKDHTIFVVSERRDTRSRAAAINVGADEYVSKPYLPRRLLSKVLACLRASIAASPNALVAGPIEADLTTQTVRVAGQTIILTETEFAILTALLGATGSVLDRPQLLQMIRGSAEFRNPTTIDAHVSRLRRKLGRAGAAWLRTIRTRGFAVRAPGGER